MLLPLSLIIENLTPILKLAKPNENCWTKIFYYMHFQDGENMCVRRSL